MNNTLIEFFDPDAIHNLIEVLLLRPKSAVFLYDTDVVSEEELNNLECACREAIPGFTIQREPAVFSDIQSLSAVCARAVNDHPGCAVDVTGGGELPAIAAYVVCAERKIPLFQVDVQTRKVIEILPAAPKAADSAHLGLSLEMLLMARGASCGGFSHVLPPAEQYRSYRSFCHVLFDDLGEWKTLCRYLQTGCTQCKQDGQPLCFSAPHSLISADGKHSEVRRALLQSAEQCGLICDFRDSEEGVSFRFADATAKKYLTDFGVWLEFFSYHELSQEAAYFDLKMSLRVDWRGRKKTPVEVVNEIDVAFMCDEKPVFLSCKLSEPPVEALYELSMYARYFGGITSRCVLVVMSDVSEQGHLMARAKEMGILVIHRPIVLSGGFLDAMSAFLT